MASLMSNSSFGKIPSGTTANRPASPVVGDQYYNGTIGALEVYTSAGWKTATIAQGNTAGRPATPFAGQLYSNGELQRLELYTGALYGWQNIVAETPGVTGYTGNVLESNSTNTITITGTNFATGAVASLIGTDGTEYIANSTTVNNLTSITATFGAISAAKEPYDIKVTNPSNLYGVYYDVLTVNDTPIWSTSAGNLATFFDSTRSSVNIALSATDEENNTLTYSIVSGSLPSGVTLNSSTGVISGTAAAVVSDTTYSFVARVSDGSNTADRSFNIVVKAPIITTFTYTGSDQSYTLPAGASTFKAYIWGAGGGNYLASGFRGGGGGYTTGTVTSSSPGTSFVVVVGQGGESRGGNAGTGAKRYGGGGQLTSLGWGGQGGGLSGIFTGTSQVFNVNTPQTGAFARSVLIAGGGGGSGDVGWGGSGGGTSGRNIYTNTSGG
ncbi:cadherin repeat domain-containing protein, partial [bacterium]|nr:cadherin repeat domain-containing protein [bacterium]